MPTHAKSFPTAGLRFQGILAVAVPAVLIAGPGAGTAPAAPLSPVSASILFLDLEAEDGGFLLRSASVHPGQLKIPRGRPAGPLPLRYDLLGEDGERLESGSLSDPREGRRLGFETFDPDRGTWLRTAGEPGSGHFTVRVPYRPDLRFVRLVRPGGRLDAPGEAETELGTFAIPPGMSPAGPGATPRDAPVLRPMAVTGSPRHRINIIFLAEGYTRLEMPLFRSYARDAFDYLMSLDPFRSYASLFNAYYLEVLSRESGCDHPGTASDEGLTTLPVGYVDTYFDSSFDFGGTHRCVYIGDVPLAFDTLAEGFAGYDITVVVVNSSEYGGCAGDVAVGTSTGQSKFLIAHEIGHTFIHLADEYEDNGFAAPRPDPDRGVRITDPAAYAAAVSGPGPANVSATAVREGIPWSIWIEPSTPLPTPETEDYAGVIGAFHGAFGTPTGGYRPELRCLMRDLTDPFCEVCAEAAVKCIYNLLDPIQDALPDSGRVSLAPGDSVTLSVVPLVPDDHALAVSWLADGVPVAGADGESLIVAGADLAAGLHTVTATVFDPTPAVRNDPDGLLQSSRQWTVERLPGSSPAAPGPRAGLQARPNPFSWRTSVTYDLPAPATVRLEAFDLQGRRVAVLEEREVPAGSHRAVWDGRLEDGGRAPAGIYFLRLRAGGRSTTTRVVLTRGN